MFLIDVRIHDQCITKQKVPQSETVEKPSSVSLGLMVKFLSSFMTVDIWVTTLKLPVIVNLGK